MRILQVVTQLEPGGAQKVAVDLNNNFDKKGLESKVLFLYKKGKHLWEIIR